jgi:2-polyprenyl-3-methyl-5-hydroxy-6-metoxy-1,4-benzoquinol methylase
MGSALWQASSRATSARLLAVHAKSRETNSSALRVAMLRRLGRRIAGKGQIAFPCAPTLLDPYVEKLGAIFDVLGKPFNDEDIEKLRQIVQEKLESGWRASPFSLMTVAYETRPPPHPGVQYTIATRVLTMDEHYQSWVAFREPPLFGKLADAKVLDAAASLGPAPEVPVLDVGAGTGRNAIPLARLGHPIDAIEPVEALAGLMKKGAEEQNAAVSVIEGNILDPALELKRGHYKLVVMAEVIASHFGDTGQIRQAITRLSGALAPGGLLLFNTFLAVDGYKPDTMARQVSQLMWSCVFTRNDLSFIAEELPLTLLADESAFEYEKQHLPAESWPPTGWFATWSQGRDLFALPPDKSPVELRWLTYRRL